MQRRRSQSTLSKASAAALLALLLAAAVHTATAFLIPAAPLESTSNSGMLSRTASQQQRQRPMKVAPAAAKRGGKGYGNTGGGGAGSNAGPAGVDGRSLRGYTKVLVEGGELGAAANSQKAVGPVKFAGEDKFVLLVRRQGGGISALDANCGRCKFPLLNGKVVTDTSKEMEGEEDKEVITCPLCAVTHSLADGRVTGAQASGMLQKMSASFFSKQVATGVKAYEAAAGNDGAVYAKLR